MKQLLFIALSFICLNSIAQVAISKTNATPNASSMLDISSTNKGLLIPRMTKAQRLAIPSPANGLLVYDTTTQGLYVYKTTQGWTQNGFFSFPLSVVDSFKTRDTSTIGQPCWIIKSINCIFNTNKYFGNAGSFNINSTTNSGDALIATTAGIGNAFNSSHSGTSGSAGVFSNINATNLSTALDASTVGDGYAGTFRNTLNTATNSGAIQAYTDASSGTGYPNVILSQANGTLGTTGFFYSTNPNNVRPTMVVRNDGLERVLIVSATNHSNHADALTVDAVGDGATIHATNSDTSGIGGSAGIFAKFKPSSASYSAAPYADLEVRHPNLGAGTPGLTGLRILNTGANANSWTLYTNNSSGALQLYYKNTSVGSFATTGVYTATSDARLKSNIVTMPNVLGRLMQLKPKTYSYSFDEAHRQMLGFLAQEVEPLFPQVVYRSDPDTKNDYYKMDYSAFGVIAVKAVQEQQKIIENQQQQIDGLKREIEEIKRLIGK